MLPWAHAGFGYLLYHGYTAQTGRRVGGGSSLALVLGTQLPDLVDKPLAWTFAVLPSGRTLGHSVFTFVGLVLVLWVLFGQGRRRAIVAFAIGYASHLVADGIAPLVRGEFASLGYLLWPVTAAPIEDEGYTFIGFFTSLEASVWVLFGLCLTTVGLVVWAADGYPGVRDVLLPLVTGGRDEAETDL